VISQLWGALIKQSRKRSVCGLDQDGSWCLVGRVYPISFASLPHLFPLISGGSTILSGLGVPVCRISVFVCEYLMELESKVITLYKTLLNWYTAVGMALISITAYGGPSEPSYDDSIDALTSVYGYALGAFQLLVILMFLNFMKCSQFNLDASNYNEYLHTINCFIAFSSISLFGLFSSLFIDAISEKYVLHSVIFCTLGLINIAMHFEAMAYVANTIFLSQIFLLSNFYTTIENNILNYLFRNLYKGHPLIIVIGILHIALITIYLIIMISIDGQDTLTLNDTIDGIETHRAYEHNAKLSPYGAIGDYFYPPPSEPTVEMPIV